jgi:excisionase family DNA binding protein
LADVYDDSALLYAECMMEDLITVTEAARLKKVSRSAIYTALAEGRLPGTRVLGRLVLKKRDVHSWQPEPHKGRPQGIAMSDKSKRRISQGQRRRWLLRQRGAENAGGNNAGANKAGTKSDPKP